MTIQLGTLTLPDEVLWIDKHQEHAVGMSTAHTLGGRLVVWSAALSEGRPITLAAHPTQCWLSSATVADLQTMATLAGATYPFRWPVDATPAHDEQYNVVFRFLDPPALSFTPVRSGSDQWTGTIRLMTV
jgi:hypothetical protein